MTNCNKPRCYWSGQLNSGECECHMANTISQNKDYLADETLIGMLEEGRFENSSKLVADYISRRLQAFTGQDRIFRLINKMVATSK